MPFESLTYRVLIASPSDLIEERQAATAAINDWNADHADTESVVFLPVKWETHAFPETGTRPQDAINWQMVRPSDVLIGMFWTKFGRNNGVAESGTVEEIDQFVSARKPAMLYFSNRPVNPSHLNLDQLDQLRAFKADTYERALVSTFASVEQLAVMLARDLTSQVRALKAKRRRRRGDRLEEAARLTDLIRAHREQGITPEEFRTYEELVGLRRASNPMPTDPLRPGETSPNGYRVGYTTDGDKVEWIPSDDPEKECPLILRRGDMAIQAAYGEYWDKVWYGRHMALYEAIKNGEVVPPDAVETILGQAEAARRIERKYGLKNRGWDEFEWGMLSGRMSALAWVLGME